ncbi:MAG: hypothetical protein K2R93_12545 [Gemmatimonadaceae bacterium]|nr:hypothetical protein [Gemmatimonadaceae bacterium]
MSATNRTQSTVARVSARWQECAVHVRGELRQYGVRGELRRLDDYARRDRGAGMARFLADFVAYCHEKGMSGERIAQHLGAFTAEAVADVTNNRSA